MEFMRCVWELRGEMMMMMTMMMRMVMIMMMIMMMRMSILRFSDR
jgi:hypothetical protein